VAPAEGFAQNSFFIMKGKNNRKFYLF